MKSYHIRPAVYHLIIYACVAFASITMAVLAKGISDIDVNASTVSNCTLTGMRTNWWVTWSNFVNSFASLGMVAITVALIFGINKRNQKGKNELHLQTGAAYLAMSGIHIGAQAASLACGLFYVFEEAVVCHIAYPTLFTIGYVTLGVNAVALILPLVSCACGCASSCCGCRQHILSVLSQVDIVG
jgi:hypothetical protein